MAVDHLYFGDLGGQIFRVDLNNNQTKTNSTYSSFGVRVVRLANLATNDSTYDGTNDYTGGNAPRFMSLNSNDPRLWNSHFYYSRYCIRRP